MSDTIYTSAEQLIGRTPLLELTRIAREEALEARVLVKLERSSIAGPPAPCWTTPDAGAY